MKTIIIFLILVPTVMFAQQDWPIIGAQWVQGQQGNAEDPNLFFDVIECTGETTVDGLNYRIVQDPTLSAPYLIHQDENKFYYLYDDTLRLVYDFGVAVGDTVEFELLRGNFPYGEIFKTRYIIDSLTQVNVDGVILDKVNCTIHYDDPSVGPFYPQHYNYIERIGNTRRIIENRANEISTLASYPDFLRCYIDNEIEYHQGFEFLGIDSCFQDIINDVQEEIAGVQISVSPNPTTDYLNIYQYFSEAEVWQKGQYRIVDSQGRVVEQFEVEQNDVTMVVPVWEWAKGVYFLQLVVDNEVVTTEKFVVQ